MTTFREPEPARKGSCGYVLDGVHRCGKPAVARLTEQYAVGERTELCVEHRDELPETAEWDGETFPTTEPL